VTLVMTLAFGAPEERAFEDVFSFAARLRDE
jgi:hypothetical protein